MGFVTVGGHISVKATPFTAHASFGIGIFISMKLCCWKCNKDTQVAIANKHCTLYKVNKERLYLKELNEKEETT